MNARPKHPPEPGRVPRSAQGIATALTSARRMEFYRELLTAAPETAQGVLRYWWCEATLDRTHSVGDRLTEAALAGTLLTHTVSDIVARRRAAGLPAE
ncbi:hypothetical protein AB0M86_47210 [Streptomyces sp. NPDC051639]|uniref:hypothetical protein n=1 Tax=Streptomyces sp. NPDC051639 TaxID=3155671 RepID=UPI0034372867